MEGDVIVADIQRRVPHRLRMVVDRPNLQAIDQSQKVDLRTFGRSDHCDSINTEIWRVLDVPLLDVHVSVVDLTRFRDVERGRRERPALIHLIEVVVVERLEEVHEFPRRRQWVPGRGSRSCPPPADEGTREPGRSEQTEEFSTRVTARQTVG
jgi:hypothetical protein